MSVACQSPTAFKVAVSATVLFLSGCANEQQQVAGHRYDVPRSNLVPTSNYPFFLPKSQDDEFIFILNPNAGLRQQTSVLVQGRDAVCTRANGQGYVSRTICGPNSIEWKGGGWIKTGDDTRWTYSPDKLASTDAPFISCHKMGIEGHSGLCNAVLPLDDLVLSISLEDDELPVLDATYQRAVTMLRSWEM